MGHVMTSTQEDVDGFSSFNYSKTVISGGRRIPFFPEHLEHSHWCAPQSAELNFLCKIDQCSRQRGSEI